jgi:two-component system chemotaxis response regulator CheY
MKAVIPALAFNGFIRGSAGKKRGGGMERGILRILVVDDSSTMRQLLKMILRKHFVCEVSEAMDGQCALEQLEAGRYDLVLTDVNMPRLDGLGLVRAVRTELKSDVPIVMLTTRGAEDDRDRGLSLGANSYLTKPVNAAQMMQAISSLVP